MQYAVFSIQEGMMQWVLACTILVLLLTGCGTTEPTPTPTVLPTVAPTSTNTPIPTATNTSVPTVAPTTTTAPSATPLPTRTATPTPTITYVTLGSPFAKDCGQALMIVDNSFNGSQGTLNQNSGHVDLWVKGCDTIAFDGEVIAPVTGVIEKAPNSYRIALPKDTYLVGMEDALKFMGIANPILSDVKGLVIDLGHIELLPGLNPGTVVEKGQRMANLIPSTPPSPKLAYQINFWYGASAKIGAYDTNFKLASPTLFGNDTSVPLNFSYPSENLFLKAKFGNGFAPFQCDLSMQQVMGKVWQPYYCYPEPNAQH